MIHVPSFAYIKTCDDPQCKVQINDPDRNAVIFECDERTKKKRNDELLAVNALGGVSDLIFIVLV